LSTDTEIFHVMKTMRAMRRLKRDPVPDHVLAQVLEAGTCAPSGQNLQRWSFLVVEDDAGKQFFGERYAYWMRERFADVLRGIDYDSAAGRQAKAAMHLADHMHEAPVLLFCCGTRDWPFAVAPAQRVGRAPPSYGSIYPAVQNILLGLSCPGPGRESHHHAPDVRRRHACLLRYSRNAWCGGRHPHWIPGRQVRSDHA
jgi:nitroreductase